MGVTKTNNYTKEQIKLAGMAKVIGHPARLSILQLLLKRNSCICGEIVEEIGLSQATISQHLREMKDFGLIRGDIDGTKVCYCIDPKVYKQFKTMLAKLFSMDLDGNGCC